MSGLTVGGGIVGLTTALMLHRSGIEVAVYEEALKIKELGVGLNLLPRSVKHLIGLGLQATLDDNAIRTGELRFFCKKGKSIWREPQGLEAGYEDQGDPQFAGLMLWRGATVCDPFLSSRTMIMAGHNDQKVVIYPISNPDESGKQLINWVAESRVPLDTILRDDWNNEGHLEAFADRFEDWKFDWLDISNLFQHAGKICKFPMVDRDPVKQWSFDRVTLAGDAAHAMCPNGSNGASQGILDAVSLARHLSAHENVATAFKKYEEERLPPTSRLVFDNRKTGPERVLQLVEERCVGQCGDEHVCVAQAELGEIAQAYKKLAGFDKSSVNRDVS